MFDAEVMQATGDDHDQIRKIIFRISQNIFHDPGAFDARNGMLHSDTNFGYLAIVLLLFGGQFFLVRLFFG